MDDVLRRERIQLADAFEAYHAGEIDNFALDEVVCSKEHLPRTMWAVWIDVWSSYDDFRLRRAATSAHARAVCRRVVAFLRSDFEYFAPPQRRAFFGLIPRTLIRSYWPFVSQSDWLACRVLTSIEAPAGFERSMLQYRRR